VVEGDSSHVWHHSPAGVGADTGDPCSECFRAHRIGKNASSRLKRLGVEPQLARARAGLLLEWIRLCLRHGWVGSWKKRNKKEPFVYKAAAQLERVINARMKRLLDLPYGAAAEKPKLHKGGAPPPMLLEELDW